MSRGVSNRISKQQVDPAYEARLRLHLDKIWGGVVNHLRELQRYIIDNLLTEKDEEEAGEAFWNTETFSKRYNELYELCSCHDCIYYEVKLYEKYQEHVREYLMSLLPVVEEKHGEEMVTYIIKLWKAFKDVYVKYLLKLLSYLDRYYVRNENKDGLRKVAHKYFRNFIYDKVSTKLNGMMLQKIQRDRTDGLTDFRRTIRNGVVMFRDMDLSAYTDVFEVELIKESHIFFKMLSEEWIQENSIVRYFQKAKERIKREENMLTSLFPDDTQRKLRTVMLEELLVHRRDRLLNQEFRNLIRDQKFKELNLVYVLMKKVPDGIVPIAKILFEHILGEGKAIYEQYSNQVKGMDDHQKMVNTLVNSYVEELIDLKEKLIELICRPFQQDSECVKCFTSAFKEFVNLEFKREKSEVVLKAPQIFAYYCDEKIRKNVEKLDDKLTRIVDFIQFFKEKDLFVLEYKKQLSNRLLNHQKMFMREEEERGIIGKIKYRYRGISDLYKLERMLSDKISSREMKEEYKVFLKNHNQRKKNQYEEDLKEAKGKGSGKVVVEKPIMVDNVDVTVLKQGAWPIAQSQEQIIPPLEIQSAQQTFSQWYDSRHTSRVLYWSYEHSCCQVLANFRAGRKTIDLTTYQTVLLLLFNNDQSQQQSQQQQQESVSKKIEEEEEEEKVNSNGIPNKQYTIKEISVATKLRRSKLVPCLISLTQKKYKLLLIKSTRLEELKKQQQQPQQKKKRKKGRSQWWKDPETIISVNPNFSHRKTKFRIPMPRVTENATRQSQSTISKDRSLTIDAAIVRIMKARRKLSMQNIISETIKQIHIFQPSIKQIKKRVEVLIEGEYIVRSDEDHRIIIYNA